MSSVLMTAKVCINDLWIDLCSLLSRGTLVDFVQDTISCGTQSEVGAKQLKSAEIQEITEASQVVFMKLGRIFFALLLGCWCVIASRVYQHTVTMKNSESWLFFFSSYPLSCKPEPLICRGFSFRLRDGHGVPVPDVMPVNLRPTQRWLLWAVNSFWSAAPSEPICSSTQIEQAAASQPRCISEHGENAHVWHVFVMCVEG